MSQIVQQQIAGKSYEPCTAMLTHDPTTRCSNRPIPGGKVCTRHGGNLPQVREAGLRRDTVAQAKDVGVDVPMHVSPEDFPIIIGEYIARFNRVFARLERELDEFRQMDTPEIELARAYSDIMERQAVCSKMVTHMMQAAASLGLQVNDRPDPERAAQEFLASIDTVHALQELV